MVTRKKEPSNMFLNSGLGVAHDPRFGNTVVMIL